MNKKLIINIIFIVMLAGTILMLYWTYIPSVECTNLLKKFNNQLNGTMLDTCNTCVGLYKSGMIYRP